MSSSGSIRTAPVLGVTSAATSAPLRHRWFVAPRLALDVFLFAPFIVLYARSIGLSFAAVMAAESFFYILVVVLDLPTAHLADRIGAKRALMLGGVLQSVACLSLSLVPLPSVFWAMQILFATSMALGQGADAAYNLQLLRRQGAEDRFEASESRYLAVKLVADATAYFVGGILAVRGYRYPLLATACLQTLGVLALSFLPNLRTVEDRAALGLIERLRGVKQACVSSMGAVRHVAVMVLAGTAFGTLLYLAPALAQNASIESYRIGVLFAVATLAGGTIVLFLQRLPPWVAYAIGLAGFGGMASGHFFVLALGVAFIKAAQAVLIPRFRRETISLFARLDDSTAMSVVTTSNSLGFALIAPFFGHLSDVFGIRALLFSCIAVFGLAIVVHAVDRRVRQAS